MSETLALIATLALYSGASGFVGGLIVGLVVAWSR
jgi:hypothetical protein